MSPLSWVCSEGDIDIIPQPRHSKIRGHLKTSLIIGLPLIQYLIYYSLIEYVWFTGDTKLEHHGVRPIACLQAQTSTYTHPIPQLILSNFLFLELQIAGVFDDRLGFCIIECARRYIVSKRVRELCNFSMPWSCAIRPLQNSAFMFKGNQEGVILTEQISTLQSQYSLELRC